jgi:ankyrin repeat protein
MYIHASPSYYSLYLLLAGMTPLLAASVTGHTHIVEYLIKLPDLVSRTERVDALEILGATYVDKKRDMVGALELWKRAMDDRQDYFSIHIEDFFSIKISPYLWKR